MPLSRVTKGQVIRAEEHNKLIDLVNALERAGGRSIEGGGEPLPAPQGFGFYLRAVVSAVHGAGPTPPEGTPWPATPAALVTYDVFILYKEVTLLGVRPDLGRPVEPMSMTKIVPPLVGTECNVVRYPDGEGGFKNYVILSERLRFRVCG